MHVAALAGSGDVHELVRVAHGKTFEQQQIQETKDRRTGADADGEREDRGGRETRRAQVGTKIVDDRKTARFATGLLPADDIAELLARVSFRIRARHPLRFEVRRASLQVEPHLAVHVVFHARAPEPRTQERRDRR